MHEDNQLCQFSSKTKFSTQKFNKKNSPKNVISNFLVYEKVFKQVWLNLNKLKVL